MYILMGFLIRNTEQELSIVLFNFSKDNFFRTKHDVNIRIFVLYITYNYYTTIIYIILLYYIILCYIFIENCPVLWRHLQHIFSDPYIKRIIKINILHLVDVEELFYQKLDDFNVEYVFIKRRQQKKWHSKTIRNKLPLI